MLAAAAALLLAGPVAAAVTVTTGAGSAVVTADRTATFDSIDTSGIDLSTYSEGGLSLTSPNSSSFVNFDPFSGDTFPSDPTLPQFRGFHYGPNNTFVSIRGTDGVRMFAVEYRHGDGWVGASESQLRWRTLDDGVPTGEGTLGGTLSPLLKGEVVGFSDPTGFDELHVMAFNGPPPDFDTGALQAIAIDNLVVDTQGSSNVLNIGIDIRPGVQGDFINVRTADKIAVALRGDEDFDVLDVDVSTLAFGPAAAPPFLWAGVAVDDVDLDNIDDLVVHFRLEESGIQLGETQACVTGELLDGSTIQGCDTIAVVACGLGFELAFLLPPLAWLRARRRRLEAASARAGYFLGLFPL